MDRTSERGTLALFGIMMALVFMTVGGLSIELWSVLGQRRQLSAIADAAVAAGAGAIDEEAYRIDGTLMLVPELARQRAAESVRAQDSAVANPRYQFVATQDRVAISVDAEVDLIILGLIGAKPLRVTVRSEAAPFSGS